MDLRNECAVNKARRTVLLKSLAIARRAKAFYGPETVKFLQLELAQLRAKIRQQAK